MRSSSCKELDHCVIQPNLARLYVMYIFAAVVFFYTRNPDWHAKCPDSYLHVNSHSWKYEHFMRAHEQKSNLIQSAVACAIVTSKFHPFLFCIANGCKETHKYTQHTGRLESNETTVGKSTPHTTSPHPTHSSSTLLKIAPSM